MSDLVGNLEDWFSHSKAHLMTKPPSIIFENNGGRVPLTLIMFFSKFSDRKEKKTCLDPDQTGHCRRRNKVRI